MLFSALFLMRKLDMNSMASPCSVALKECNQHRWLTFTSSSSLAFLRRTNRLLLTGDDEMPSFDIPSPDTSSTGFCPVFFVLCGLTMALELAATEQLISEQLIEDP